MPGLPKERLKPWRNPKEDQAAPGQRPTGGDKAVATQKKQYFRRKKVCRFCVEKIDDINYKDVKMLHAFVAERGKDRSAPHFGRVRAAPAAPHRRHQEGAQHRAAAVRGAVLGQEETVMEVILREDIEKLGTRGQVVKVAPGYARNFLLPKKLAVAATDSNKKIVEQERQAHLRKEAKLQGEAQDLAKLMTGVSVTITQKAGENDQLFGSVTSKDVADALAAQRLHHRPPQDPVGRAHQAVGRVQGAGAAAQGRDRRSHRGRRQRRVVSGEQQNAEARAVVPGLRVFAFR